MTTPAQIRAGRQLASLSQSDIAEATGLSLPTVKRVESERPVSVSADAIAAIREALEAAGVVFLGDGEAAPGGPGVRLARPHK